MKKHVLVLFAAALLAGPMSANAALIYTFNYDALENYGPASISFTTSSFVSNVGDTLAYLSGDINGCAPASLSIDSLNAFATPVFANGSCGDGLGPSVDGLFFRPDTMPPLATGTFVSSGTAGRQFEISNGNFYRYTRGSLTISQYAVPEPAALMLLGLGLVGLAATRRRRGA